MQPACWVIMGYLCAIWAGSAWQEAESHSQTPALLGPTFSPPPHEMAKPCGASATQGCKQGDSWVQQELSHSHLFTADIHLLTFLWMGVGTL